MSKLIGFIFCLFTSSVFCQKFTYDTVFLQNFGIHKLWDGREVGLFSFTYNETQPAFLPGKIIYAEEGDSVKITASTISNDGLHTIHLHGVDANTLNDGDPMTSFPLNYNSHFTYSFLAKNAGTYIYHCHVGDVMHVQMGMYALLIIKSKESKKTAWTNGPAYDVEYSWLLSELSTYWHENTPEANMNDFKIPKYEPDYFLINGKSKQQLNDSATTIIAKANEKVYLRLANIGFYKQQVIFPSPLNSSIIDSDGRPLPSAIKNDTVELTPGERYGVMLSCSYSFSDKIKVNFIDMNTNKIKGTELVPINILMTNDLASDLKSSERIQLSPNPAKDKLFVQVQVSNSGNYNIKIKDLFGRHMSEMVCTSGGKKELPIEFLSAGVYIVEVDVKGKKFMEKFVKE